MRDPACGYDFVDRLNARGDLIDRLMDDQRKRRLAVERRRRELEEQEGVRPRGAGRKFNERAFEERQRRLLRRSAERKQRIIDEELARNRGPRLNARSARILAGRPPSPLAGGLREKMRALPR